MDASRLFVPDREKDHTEIAAKAYLSRKDIRELIVPNSIDSIGDWAFAFMKNLEILWIPEKSIVFGKDILKGCEKLCDIMVYQGNIHDMEEGSTPQSKLYASAVMRFGVSEFLKPKEMGKETWYQKLDEYLTSWLEKDDLTGFKPQWFGGEEDYLEDATNSKDHYRKLQEYLKLEFVFQRLNCEKFLSKTYKSKYIDYIQSCFMKEDDVEQNMVLRFLFGQVKQLDYIRIFLTSGVASVTQITKVIEKLQKESPGDNPEVVSMLLDYATEHVNTTVDLFDDFIL